MKLTFFFHSATDHRQLKSWFVCLSNLFSKWSLFKYYCTYEKKKKKSLRMILLLIWLIFRIWIAAYQRALNIFSKLMLNASRRLKFEHSHSNSLFQEKLAFQQIIYSQPRIYMKTPNVESREHYSTQVCTYTILCPCFQSSAFSLLADTINETKVMMIKQILGLKKIVSIPTLQKYYRINGYRHFPL